MQPNGGFGAPGVMELTGLTFRRLDYWARSGLVGPSGMGSGNHRSWSPREMGARLMARSTPLLTAFAALVSGCAQAPPPVVPSVSTAAPSTTGATDKSTALSTAGGLMSTPSQTNPPGEGEPARTASTVGPSYTPEGSPVWHTGNASYYAEGAVTASGERFNPDGLTAAHRTLPFGTRIRVCRVSGVRACVYVRVNDRGPFVTGRVLDLSRGAMSAIGGIGAGVISVHWAVVG